MTEQRVYVTYFDSGYLARALVMVRSLRQVGERGRVFAVCFDAEALAAAGQWPDLGVTAIGVSEVEQAFPQLLEVKDERSTPEYFFTCTPWVLEYVLTERVPDARWATYLDADLCFFASTESVYDELNSSSVGIIAHDYLPRYRKLEKFGRFNVGWVSFANDEAGRRVLHWWADRTLEWCHDKPEQGRFADQGYLDSFQQLSDRVHTIKGRGANLAPWNLGGRHVTVDSTRAIRVDGDPLVFFHFHGLRRRRDRYFASHIEFGARANVVVREAIYRPYVERLVAAEAELGRRPAPARRGRGLRGAALWARRLLFDGLTAARHESFAVAVPDPSKGTSP